MKNFLKISSLIAVSAFSPLVNAESNPFEQKLQQQLQAQLENQIPVAPILGEQKAEVRPAITNPSTTIINETPNKINTGFIMDFENSSKLDFINDENLNRYVGPDSGLTNTYYEPKDLVNIAGKYISGSGKIRKEAKQNLVSLSENFYKKFHKNIKIVSAYRSYSKQVEINKSNPKCVKTLYCAKPGHSEHQLGLAVDIGGLQEEIFKSGEYKNYFDWMRENAHEYGWVQSYQKGPEIDGYNKEPWHWRYIGKDIATELYSKNMTISELARK